jgi:hypothetical protein
MISLLDLITTLVAIWLALDALSLLVVCVGIYFVRPRWSEWWKDNIADLDPSEHEFRHQPSSIETVGEPLDRLGGLIASRHLRRPIKSAMNEV